MNSLATDTVLQRTELAAVAARYHAMGWMFGTSGNLSVRVDDRICVTASGRDKGTLSSTDFVEVDVTGALLASGPDARPSAETSIHTSVYAARPKVQAVLHVHTPASTVVSQQAFENAKPLDFTGLEMVKGWGLWTPNTPARLRTFANHPEVPMIGDEIGGWLAGTSAENQVPACLISGHGITAWGATIAEAHRHVEVTEFLCRVALARP